MLKIRKVFNVKIIVLIVGISFLFTSIPPYACSDSKDTLRLHIGDKYGDDTYWRLMGVIYERHQQTIDKKIEEHVDANRDRALSDLLVLEDEVEAIVGPEVLKRIEEAGRRIQVIFVESREDLPEWVPFGSGEESEAPITKKAKVWGHSSTEYVTVFAVEDDDESEEALRDDETIRLRIAARIVHELIGNSSILRKVFETEEPTTIEEARALLDQFEREVKIIEGQIERGEPVTGRVFGRELAELQVDDELFRGLRDYTWRTISEAKALAKANKRYIEEQKKKKKKGKTEIPPVGRRGSRLRLQTAEQLRPEVRRPRMLSELSVGELKEMAETASRAERREIKKLIKQKGGSPPSVLGVVVRHAGQDLNINGIREAIIKDFEDVDQISATTIQPDLFFLITAGVLMRNEDGTYQLTPELEGNTDLIGVIQGILDTKFAVVKDGWDKKDEIRKTILEEIAKTMTSADWKAKAERAFLQTNVSYAINNQVIRVSDGAKRLSKAMYNRGFLTPAFTSMARGNRLTYNFKLNIVAFDGASMLGEIPLYSLNDFIKDIKGLSKDQRAVIIAKTDTQAEELSAVFPMLSDKDRDRVFIVTLEETTNAYREWSALLEAHPIVSAMVTEPRFRYDFSTLESKDVLPNLRLIKALATAK